MKSLVDKNTAERLLAKGDRVAVAVSGGKDSMALLRWFLDQAEASKISFFVVNFEHGLRGESSVKDSEFVEEYCKKQGIEILLIKLDCQKAAEERGETVEQAARSLRYFHFQKLLDEGRCNKIATAHHADDNAETILMREFRGTGIRGLCGIDENREGKYIRPLLETTREEIDEFIQKNNIPFVEDETNTDTKYRRNFIRHKLLPLIKTEYPNVVESLGRLSRNAAESDAYVKNTVLEKFGDTLTINARTAVIKLCGQSDFELKQLLGEAFRGLEVFADIEERHFALLLNLKNLKNGAKIDMPFGVTAHVEYGKLTIERIYGAEPEEMSACGLEKGFGFGGYVIDARRYDGAMPRGGEILMDVSKIPKTAKIRNRREGDYILKFGGGKKSLGDFFTDKKVPLRIRDRLPILANDEEVLAVFGFEISKKMKVDEINIDNKNLYIFTMEDLCDERN